jgi:hypothetical protein
VRVPTSFEPRACCHVDTAPDAVGSYHSVPFICSQGGGVFISSGVFFIVACILGPNMAGDFSGTTLFVARSSSNSTIANCTFNDTSDAAIVINSLVHWICPLGHYMPRAGTFFGVFDGCLYSCTIGYYGDSSHLVAPAGDYGCKSCDVGHFCNSSGTMTPLPCPPGTHMPFHGASSESSCLPYDTRDAIESCVHALRGVYSTSRQTDVSQELLEQSGATTTRPVSHVSPDTTRLSLVRQCAALVLPVAFAAFLAP